MTVFEDIEPVPIGDRYHVHRLLAVGGMAQVYLGYREVALGLRLPVVVKMLKPQLCGDADVAKMFRDEARLATMLSHPLVVQAFDVGELEGVPFIVMEHIVGEELNQVARRGLLADRFLPRSVAVEVVRQAAEALGYCHTLRDESGAPLDLVHCDVSPNNLLLTRDGYVKLIDFGIASFAGQQPPGRSFVPGKLSYMSPEQIRREQLDGRADIYSLGVILYELTLGQRLFRGPASEVRQRIESADIEPPTFIEHDYPGFLESIVMRALERHPSDRYQSAYEMADDLAQYLASLAEPVGPVELARYVDQLREAAGEQVRPELVRELGEADDDELDFDRSREKRRVTMRQFDPGQWDELEEGVEEIASALGIDVSLVKPDATDEGEAAEEGEASDEAGADEGVASDEAGADEGEASDEAGDEEGEASDEAGADEALGRAPKVDDPELGLLARALRKWMR